jgi:hypothetical protein
LGRSYYYDIQFGRGSVGQMWVVLTDTSGRWQLRELKFGARVADVTGVRAVRSVAARQAALLAQAQRHIRRGRNALQRRRQRQPPLRFRRAGSFSATLGGQSRLTTYKGSTHGTPSFRQPASSHFEVESGRPPRYDRIP